MIAFAPVEEKTDHIEQLIVENMKLVTYCIHKYYPALAEQIEWEDLVAQGYIGLIEAAWRFDPTKGCQFSTFAVECIRGSIYKEFIRKRWRNKYKANFNTVSLDAPIKWHQKTLKRNIDFKDMFGDWDEDLKNAENRLIIRYMLDQLSEKRRRVIELYFGLNGNREHTQDEIASIIGVSQVQVSRLLKKGLQQLRKAMI
mgnify:CR=1 FL=1